MNIKLYNLYVLQSALMSTDLILTITLWKKLIQLDDRITCWNFCKLVEPARQSLGPATPQPGFTYWLCFVPLLWPQALLKLHAGFLSINRREQ